MSDCTQESFLKDVATHKLTVLRDDGVNRHLQFKRPGTRCYQFDLITWPGYLCYCGDMGDYVFTRLHDMFEFFRTDRRDESGKLFINPRYWAEKITATDKSDGHEQFSPKRFEEVVESYLEDASPELREEVENIVLSALDEGEYAAFEAIHEFEFEGFHFQDFWDHNFKEHSHRFIWCCFALAWGIAQYDALKTEGKS
jgi:hypothetical protein